mgnify:CR=1 FL=1
MFATNATLHGSFTSVKKTGRLAHRVEDLVPLAVGGILGVTRLRFNTGGSSSQSRSRRGSHDLWGTGR